MKRTVFAEDLRRRIAGLGLLGLMCVPLAVSSQVTINEIDVSAAGAGKRMLLGDLTGDGRLDFVMMQGDQMADDRYVGHQVNCLTAYDFEGNLLWQVGNPANGQSTGSDIPAQIYDIDGDGYNEVLACMDNDVISRKFVVLDGRTGDIEKTYDYPSAEAHDAIVIANLSGNDRPSDVVLKDRYANLWAMNREWDLLFTHSGNIGHYPWPSDYDLDGADELMAGYDFLESDGRRAWTVAQAGHADCIWVGDIDADPSNGKEIALGGDDITVYNKDGVLIAREDMPVEPQNIAIGDFRPDLPGLEIGGQDRRDRGTPGEEAIFLWSPMRREMLFYNTRSGWGSIANMVHNWDGTGSDFLSVWRGPAPPALFNGRGEEVVTFAEGYLMNGDVDGDGTSEVIIFTETRAVLYSHGHFDLKAAITGRPRPQVKMHYNFTRYWGGEYPPFEAVSEGDTEPDTGGDSETGDTVGGDDTAADPDTDSASSPEVCGYRCQEHCRSLGGAVMAGSCENPAHQCCDMGTGTEGDTGGAPDSDTGGGADSEQDKGTGTGAGWDGDTANDTAGDTGADANSESDSERPYAPEKSDAGPGVAGGASGCGCRNVSWRPDSLLERGLLFLLPDLAQ